MFVLVLGVAGCGGSESHEGHSGHSSTVAATATSAPAAGGDCATTQWPQVMPDFRGKRLGETVVGAALCYDIAAVTAPDGSDVRQDPNAMTTPWVIAEQSPAPGASLTASTPVTFEVQAAPRN
ncbi:hypothetical protein ACFYTQ_36335 [Nocardia sp. NPDC004068]|uniref:hypothetical protein n=1 Tax=Nocardia sp. NPDC004068 TaxID=3364303 RepID=UPI00367F7BD6